MSSFRALVLVIGMAAASAAPAQALQVESASPQSGSTGGESLGAADSGRMHRISERHRRTLKRQQSSLNDQRQPRSDGGYHVNRFGYGNFVGGAGGSFAGYPAGSAGAQIYRQQQEWKCEYAPETC